MIALLLTLLIAVYALGPDLVARWILGFVVPRKNLVQTRSEEITRGILWASIPLFLAWSMQRIGPFSYPEPSWPSLQVIFSSMYSEPFFSQHQKEFYSAAESFFEFNVCLALRLYLIVIFVSIGFNLVILNYGSIRNRFASSRMGPLLRPILSTVVLPRISEWHVILSPILLPTKKMNIEVDVLTKTGVLYQGSLQDKIIAGDGTLHSLTLGAPRRFKRDQFLKERIENEQVKADNYWKPIPGNLFVILASDITTLNVRHMPNTVRRFGQEFTDIAQALKLLNAAVQAMQVKKPDSDNS